MTRKQLTYPCLPVPTSRSQQSSHGTQIDRNHRVLVTLKHTLHRCRSSVPELNPAIFGTGNDPLPVVRNGNRENIVLQPSDQLTGSYVRKRVQGTLCPVKFIVHWLLLSPFFTTAPCPGVPGPVAPLPPPGPSFLFPLGTFNPLTSQNFNVLSKLPLTSPLPSGVKATLYTLSRCPRSRSTRTPVATSHIRTTVSREPAATNCPLGEMATEVTPASLLSESGSLMVRTWIYVHYHTAER